MMILLFIVFVALFNLALRIDEESICVLSIIALGVVLVISIFFLN